MKIHTLRLRGIGPFRDEQAIDVDEVGQQGLFLLDGPTGVGKSTIVDAIVYALFGQTATQDGQDRMVSDFLGEDIARAERPYVELVFSTPAGVFRVRREPKCPYINRNGREAEHNSTAKLWRLPNERTATESHSPGAGDLFCNGNQEVGHEIQHLLGLNREQVLSTMVLAQGQFATFLRAKSEDRRPILQSVFNTARYERLQNALLEQRKQANSRRDSAWNSFREAVAVFLSVSQLERDPKEFADSYGDDPHEQQAVVNARLEELQSAAQLLHERLRALDDTRDRTAHELAVAKETGNRITEKKDLLARMEALAGQAERIAALDADIEQAREAAKVAVSYENQMRRDKDAADAEARAEERASHLPEEERTLGPEDLDAIVRNVVADLAGLAEVLDTERALPERERDRVSLEQGIQVLAGAIAAAEADKDNLPEAIQQAEANLERASQEAADLTPAKQALTAATDAATLLGQVAQLAAQEEKQRRRLDAATADAEAADRSLSSARAQYQEGIAAELAEGLSPGTECPVCGSPEHPRPAAKADDHVSVDHLEQLEKQWRSLDEARNRAQNDLVATGTSLSSGREALGDRDRASVDAARADATQRVEAAIAAQNREAALNDDIKQMRARQQDLADKIAADRQTLAGRSADLRHLTERIATDRVAVAAARHGFDSVEGRRGHLSQRQELLESVLKARRDQAGAVKAAETARRDFAAALADSPFIDEGRFLAARRTADWITDSELQVNQHGKDTQEVQSGLESQRLTDVDVNQEFDLAALEQAADTARQQAEGCRGEWATADKTRSDAAAAGEELGKAWNGYREVDESTRAVIRLANIANGDSENLHRIKLATYVVMRRFGDVVAAANSHLAEMSDGRYRLEVSGSVGGERKMGLGLDVYDDRTDAPRSPTTLSGGETFYVSLSLALGLADVVQSEAGGVSLETLFVDEGFGSLDSETLDTVMNVLTRLSRGHRTVGLISHVDEMKRRVPDRIQIHRPDPNGPSQIADQR